MQVSSDSYLFVEDWAIMGAFAVSVCLACQMSSCQWSTGKQGCCDGQHRQAVTTPVDIHAEIVIRSVSTSPNLSDCMSACTTFSWAIGHIGSFTFVLLCISAECKWVKFVTLSTYTTCMAKIWPFSVQVILGSFGALVWKYQMGWNLWVGGSCNMYMGYLLIC